MFQYQGTDRSRPLRLTRVTLGGSHPDLRAPVTGKLIEGSARIGTPRNCSTAPCATPSLRAKSRSRRRALSSQAGSFEPSRGQLV